MLIKVDTVTLNVTRVNKIIVESKEETSFKKVGLFKKNKEIKTTWQLTLHYKDTDGDDVTFCWHGAKSTEEIKMVEQQLLSQIKEVELEHMSAALESAIRSN
jgi:hypothetical protein